MGLCIRRWPSYSHVTAMAARTPLQSTCDAVLCRRIMWWILRHSSEALAGAWMTWVRGLPVSDCFLKKQSETVEDGESIADQYAELGLTLSIGRILRIPETRFHLLFLSAFIAQLARFAQQSTVPTTSSRSTVVNKVPHCRPRLNYELGVFQGSSHKL